MGNLCSGGMSGSLDRPDLKLKVALPDAPKVDTKLSINGKET